MPWQILDQTEKTRCTLVLRIESESGVHPRPLNIRASGTADHGADMVFFEEAESWLYGSGRVNQSWNGWRLS